MADITRRSRNSDMTEGPVLKNFLWFALPIILTNLLQVFYSVADTIIVGKFANANVLGAVGTCGTVSSMIVSLFGGLAGGASVLAAQSFGARDREGLFKTVHASYAVAAAGGIALAVIGLATARPLFKLMGTPEALIEDAVCYITFIYIGIIPSMIYNFGSGLLRSVGDSRHPLIFLIVSAVINITFNLIFVAGFHWDAMGVGLSTLISEIVSAILVTVVLCRANGGHKLHLKKIRFHRKTVVKMLAIGIPTGVQSAMFAISNMIMLAYVNQFGATAVSADSVSSNIETLGFTITGAFSSAIITFSGQNYGKKQYDRLYKGSFKCILMSGAVVTGLCFLLLAFIDKLPYMFTNDSAVVEIAIKRAWILLPFIGLYCLGDTMSASVRGCGKSFILMLISILCICAVRVAWSTLVLPIKHIIEIVYISYPLSYIFYFLAIIIYYTVFKKHWLKDKE